MLTAKSLTLKPIFLVNFLAAISLAVSSPTVTAPSQLNCQLDRMPVCVTEQPSFPDRTQAVIQMKQEEAAAAEAARLEAERQAALEAARAAEAAQTVTYTTYAINDASGTLTGSVGYDVAGYNCVDLARAYGKDQPGNPISWSISTRTPFIGAAALFYFNHVAIVSGIWSNGDVELMQENAPGAAHRVSASQLRGYF